MKRFVKLSFAVMILLLCEMALLPWATMAQVAGTNVNMVSGQQWPNGDPFLQRQNEPSMAVSTRNPLHIVAGANDYRSVDLELVLSGGAETGDSWLGIFKSFDGGLTWQSTLLPGCPQAVPQCEDSGALGGYYPAGADPVVRAGTNGMFYYAGLAFQRATSPTTASSSSTIFVARYNDLNNNENLDPITYIDTHIVATGNSTQFLDKPAMAVDIPRSGALTCSFTANEPGAGPGGGPLAVHQSFAAGNIYLAYTDFLAGTKDNATPTHLMITHSKDCGVSWSTPVQLNTGTTTSQGAAIAINPSNGHLFVAWRQFGSTGVNNAIMVAESSNAGRSFSKPTQVSKFVPFDQGTTGTSFRTNAYPSIAVDGGGNAYIAFSARGLTASGDARVVVVGSEDECGSWARSVVVDNPPQNAQTNPSGRGHQIMPALAFANGKLTILYYDLRLDHQGVSYTPSSASPTGYSGALVAEGELGTSPPETATVFTNYVDDYGLQLRRHTLDLRTMEFAMFPSVAVGPSVLVSQYDYGCCLNPNAPDIEQFKFNVPNLPLFAQGSEPFLGDYIDVVPSPAFVLNGSSWVYNTKSSSNPLFHATWTDNRDVVPPADGNWSNYTPAIPYGTPSVFETGKTVKACTAGQEGMRNQNIYTAQITGGLVVGAPGNTKTLGTTISPLNGSVVPFQRAFPVVAQNVTALPINVRFSIGNQPTGGNASFLQYSILTTVDVTIPGLSSVSRSVFVTSTNPSASVTVNVTQLNAIGGTTVPNGLTAATVLNPDITNPAITNPAITNPAITNPAITNYEVTNPAITNPAITNPAITNPAITNPAITNPAITNPAITNPAITNPAITNPAITNASATNPAITNPAITNPAITNPAITNPAITNPAITNGSIQDVTYAITNNGNTTSAYTVRTATGTTVPGGIVLQLVLSKLYQTPGANNCTLGAETHLVTVANITGPKLYSLTDPQLGSSGATNPTPNEASVTLVPGETAYITLRVVNPSPSTIQFNPVTAITPVSVPQAVNTVTVLSNPGVQVTPPIVYPQLTITSPSALPATDQSNPGYSYQLMATGGKPGTDTWSITGGSLPNGISLSSSGLISGQTVALGPNSVTVQVADTAGNTGAKTFSIPVNNLFTENTQGIINDGVAGKSYIAIPFTTTGGTAPITFAASNLPPGLSMATSNGQISGNPTTPGSYLVQATATDSALPPNVVSSQITINVATPLVIQQAALPGGTIGVAYSAQLTATGGIPGVGGYVFSPPSPTSGVQVSSSGLITIANPQSSTISFGVTVHDSANPNQFANANYTILFASPLVASNLTFITQPANSVGGQVLGGGPVVVHVADSTGAAVPGAIVVLSLYSTPTAQVGCSTATLSGTLTGTSDPNGNATFSNLSVDRGQNGYALLATAGTATSVSNPFAVQGFCPSANFSTAREVHTQVLLASGTVLIAGGIDNLGNALTTAELYDPATGTVSPTGSLSDPNGRANHVSIVLPNGKVLLAGGFDNVSILATTELYDPANGTFSVTGSMAYPRVAPTGVVLADGRILVSGGFSRINSGVTLSTSEIYDPTTGLFTPTGNLNQNRGRHAMTLLPNGKVLVAGGWVDASTSFGVLSSAEIFDPTANQGIGAFTLIGNMNAARAWPKSSLLSNGTVLLVGGFSAGSTGPSLSSAEIFDPNTGLFTLTGSMSTTRARQTDTLLPDGTVMVAGGIDGVAGVAARQTAEIYTPATGTFTPTGSMTTGREHLGTTLLGNGNVLVGGGDDGVNVLGTTEVFYNNAALSPLSITTTSLSRSNLSIFNTGVSSGGTLLAPGATDPNYTITSSPTGTQAATVQYLAGTWVPNDSASQWIAPSIGSGNVGDFLFQTTFSLSGIDPATAQLSGTWGTDNEGTIFLNGVNTGITIGFNNGGYGFSSLSPFTITSGFVSGLNTLVFDVHNDGGPSGLRVVINGNAQQGVLINQPYVQLLQEQGGVGQLTWSLASGLLPPGITLTPAGVLIGAPTSVGAFTFAVTVVDSSTPQKSATSGNFTLTVSLPAAPPLSISPATLPLGVQAFPGQPAFPYSAQLQTSGGTGGALTFSVISGNLPASVSLNSSTGALSSASITDAVGAYPFTIQASSGGPPVANATQSFTLYVVPFFAGTTPNSIGAGTEKVAYTQTLTSVGGTSPFTYQLTPSTGNALPPGLSISPLSLTTAQLSGTPTAAGNYSFSIQATDSSTPAQTYYETITMKVLPQSPTTLTVQAASPGIVSLSWGASVSSDVAGYKVYRGTASGVYTTTFSVLSPSITTMVDSTATTGTTYYYAVTAVSSSGVESVYSNEVSVTP